MSEGELLTGDGVTQGIVRVGDTVRRPLRPFSLTVQAYLAHLRWRRSLSVWRGAITRMPAPRLSWTRVFRRLWEDGAKDVLPRAEAWLRKAAPAIAGRLARPG